MGILERVDDGSLVCTVSILDEFWVLTWAGCLSPFQNELDNFQVKVGVHDSSLVNSFTSQHKIAKFVKSGTTQRDIALIQLTEPIDFTSDYVNDAQLFDGDPQTIQLHSPQFVAGWGLNGRTSFISKTLPRYVVGNILAESYCSLSWNQSFDSSKDYCFLSSTTDKNVPCKGDEGSPLMYQAIANEQMGIGDRLIQVGLYYNRNDQCSANSPGLFVDIYQYQSWLTEQMACAVPGSAHAPDKCPQ